MSTEPSQPAPDDREPDGSTDGDAPTPSGEVIRERRIAAPPDRVWEVIADPDGCSEFLGGDLDVRLEPDREGSFDGLDGPVPVRIRTVRPVRHLAFDWGPADRATAVDIWLDPTGTGTRVTVREAPIAARTTFVDAVSHHLVIGTDPGRYGGPLALAA